MARLVLILVSAALALPAAGSATSGTMSFGFGRTGGNIAPFTVTISSSGAVSAVGPVRPTATRVAPVTRARLTALVKTTHFDSLPRTTRCRGALPDFASSFVTVKSAGSSRTVLVHGDCSAGFSALYRALAKAVGIPA
jgi:hypothetical protein